MAARRFALFDRSTTIIAVLVVAAGTAVLARHGSARFLAVLGGDVALFVGILPNVLAGCLIGAFVTQLLPRDAVARWVGAESGLLGIVVATMAGALLPGGPVTVYPIAAAFLAVGADAGAAIAFVISWTLLGHSRALIWELPFFGPDFVAWRVLLACPLPILAGLLARFAMRAFPARMQERA